MIRDLSSTTLLIHLQGQAVLFAFLWNGCGYRRDVPEESKGFLPEIARPCGVSRRANTNTHPADEQAKSISGDGGDLFISVGKFCPQGTNLFKIPMAG